MAKLNLHYSPVLDNFHCAELPQQTRSFVHAALRLKENKFSKDAILAICQNASAVQEFVFSILVLQKNDIEPQNIESLIKNM